MSVSALMTLTALTLVCLFFSINAVMVLVRRINKPNTFSAASESVSVANSFQLSQLVLVADLPGRRSLRSARTNRPLPVYRRRPGLPGRRTHHLEQPAGQRDICPVSVNLPSAFKHISVPGLIP